MRSTLNHHFATMAYNNAWANHRLLTACNKLSQVDFEAKRTSFFPSLKATFNHIVTVDWYYIDALERALRDQEPNREPDRFFEPEEPFETCAALASAQRDADRRLITACTLLTEDDLDRPVPVMRRLRLQSGRATLAFLSGVTLTLEGPADLDLVACKSAIQLSRTMLPSVWVQPY